MESRKYRDCPENGFLMKMLAGMDVLEHSACSLSPAHVWTNKGSSLAMFYCVYFSSPFHLKPIILCLLSQGLVASCETFCIPGPEKMTVLPLLCSFCICIFNVLFSPNDKSSLDMWRAQLRDHFGTGKLHLLPLPAGLASCLCVSFPVALPYWTWYISEYLIPRGLCIWGLQGVLSSG